MKTNIFKQTSRAMTLCLMAAGALCLGAWAQAAHAAQSKCEHFITRQGDKLMDGDKEFRFIGANMPGLILPYDYTLSMKERLHLPTPWEQEDAFKTLVQMGCRVVRLWNLPIRKPGEGPEMDWKYVQAPGKFNEEAFKTVDSILALANRYGVRVMFDFTAGYGDYLGGAKTYAAWRGKPSKAFYTDPQLKEDYKATVRFVIGRVNTITGVPYREDKAILAWQFGNEMMDATQPWLAEMAAFIKSLDSNHLLAETRHRPGAPLVVDPNIDLYTRHLYSNYAGVGDGWPATLRKELAAIKGQRPMFVGEWGPYIDGKMFTPENVVQKTREFLDYICEEKGYSGALIWSMYFHKETGGFYWHQIMTYPAAWSYHWPGFPSAEAQREAGIMSVMREAAYKIQGLPTPPLPVPDAPELLPIGNAPLLTWRGSAGGAGYDIERAPKAEGPWTTLAANVCDADVVYRPLFSDTTARAGETWFYRVSARNASGASRPSNVVGPVQVKRVCLVDELQDFSRVHEKSSGLKLDNTYNALYAEYMFRAKGKEGEWLAYETPGAIETIRVTAFFDGNAKPVAPDLTLQASADGAEFKTLEPARKERRLPSFTNGAAAGQRRNLVEYECTAPEGSRFLKIRWNGPAELDRVEIYHAGM